LSRHLFIRGRRRRDTGAEARFPCWISLTRPLKGRSSTVEESAVTSSAGAESLAFPKLELPGTAHPNTEAADTAAVDIKDVVKQKYGEAALRVKAGGSSCCGATASTGCCDPITTNLYDAAQAGQIPEEALLASLGCGNPTALAELKAGEVVLDLGSGVALTCCCRRVVSAQRAKLTVWT
jgi:hypothetical protein